MARDVSLTSESGFTPRRNDSPSKRVYSSGAEDDRAPDLTPPAGSARTASPGALRHSIQISPIFRWTAFRRLTRFPQEPPKSVGWASIRRTQHTLRRDAHSHSHKQDREVISAYATNLASESFFKLNFPCFHRYRFKEKASGRTGT